MLVTADADIQMSPEEFTMIRDFIHERSGIYFAEAKMYLIKNRLSKRMAELEIKTVRDYFYHVKYDVSQREFNRLMDLITTNETSFFRNEPQLLSFSDEVLPLIIKQKLSSEQKSIRIWSAGCSTGEEPYTLAMIVLGKLAAPAGWNIEIIANDISEEVLQKARQGEYTGMTLRNVRPELLARYFAKSGDFYRIRQEVKSFVKFSHMNLNDPRKISLVGNFDVIFCRNVMIYFSDQVKKELVRRFFTTLKPGGYFYIGHSETLHGISKAFKLVYFKNALVYQKEALMDAASQLDSASALTRTTIPLKGGASTNQGVNRALDLLKQIQPVTVKK